MAEYNVQINKYNANSLGYDQLYPQPMKHADTHLLNGSDPINVGELGVSNRNLLDNAYWANPDAIIDQQGGYVVPPGMKYYTMDWSTLVGTTDTYYPVIGRFGTNNDVIISVSGTEYAVAYYDAVRGYTGAGYGIDRWKFAISEENAAVLTIVSDGILITRNKGTSNFFTFVDVPESVIGETFTVSILIDGLGLLSKSFVVTENYKYYYWNGSTSDGGYTTIKYGDSGRKVLTVLFATGNRATTKIKAAKLEIGSQQTLAHQDENGNWVLNDPPPDKGMELWKCRQYFRVIQGATYLNGIRGYNIKTDIEVPIPGGPMRATPTPTLKGLSNIAATDGTSVVNVSSAKSATKDFFVLTADSDLSVRGPVAIYCNDTIWLDANL